MKKIYEAREDRNNCEITFATAEKIKRQFNNNLISPNAGLLYQVEADA